MPATGMLFLGVNDDQVQRQRAASSASTAPAIGDPGPWSRGLSPAALGTQLRARLRPQLRTSAYSP